MEFLSFENMRRGVDFENLIGEFASFQARKYIFPVALGSDMAWQGTICTASFTVMGSFRNYSKIKNTKPGTIC